MTLSELIARITDRLEAAGIPYMVVGSMASSFHGEPRATADLDVVIDSTPEALARFLGELPPDVDAVAARKALADRSQFNLVEQSSGWKVDLLIRRDRPFSATEFQRRQRADLLGTPGFIATAEDTIVAKLEWAKSGGSERQLRDVQSILAVSGDESTSHTSTAGSRSWISSGSGKGCGRRHDARPSRVCQLLSKRRRARASSLAKAASSPSGAEHTVPMHTYAAVRPGA